MQYNIENEKFAKEYDDELSELVINSKPTINSLTMIANENIKHAADIVTLIEQRIAMNPANTKLPVLYLQDSILKNVGKDYVQIFSKNLVKSFCDAYAQVDANTKSSLQHLLKTWIDSQLFSNQILAQIDANIKTIDKKPQSPPDTPSHQNPPQRQQSQTLQTPTPVQRRVQTSPPVTQQPQRGQMNVNTQTPAPTTTSRVHVNPAFVQRTLQRAQQQPSKINKTIHNNETVVTINNNTNGAKSTPSAVIPSPRVPATVRRGLTTGNDTAKLFIRPGPKPTPKDTVSTRDLLPPNREVTRTSIAKELNQNDSISSRGTTTTSRNTVPTRDMMITESIRRPTASSTTTKAQQPSHTVQPPPLRATGVAGDATTTLTRYNIPRESITTNVRSLPTIKVSSPNESDTTTTVNHHGPTNMAMDKAIRESARRDITLYEGVLRERAFKDPALHNLALNSNYLKKLAIREALEKQITIRETTQREAMKCEEELREAEYQRELALTEALHRDPSNRELILHEANMRKEALREEAIREKALRDEIIKESFLKENAIREIVREAVAKGEIGGLLEEEDPSSSSNNNKDTTLVSPRSVVPPSSTTVVGGRNAPARDGGVRSGRARRGAIAGRAGRTTEQQQSTVKQSLPSGSQKKIQTNKEMDISETFINKMEAVLLRQLYEIINAKKFSEIDRQSGLGMTSEKIKALSTVEIFRLRDTILHELKDTINALPSQQTTELLLELQKIYLLREKLGYTALPLSDTSPKEPGKWENNNAEISLDDIDVSREVKIKQENKNIPSRGVLPTENRNIVKGQNVRAAPTNMVHPTSKVQRPSMADVQRKVESNIPENIRKTQPDRTRSPNQIGSPKNHYGQQPQIRQPPYTTTSGAGSLRPTPPGRPVHPMDSVYDKTETEFPDNTTILSPRINVVEPVKSPVMGHVRPIGGQLSPVLQKGSPRPIRVGVPLRSPVNIHQPGFQPFFGTAGSVIDPRRGLDPRLSPFGFTPGIGFPFTTPATFTIDTPSNPQIPKAFPTVIRDILNNIQKLREKSTLNWSDPAMKNRNDAAISVLYDDFPHQCVTCGLRFKEESKMHIHYDWHFHQNKRDKQKTKKAISRMWYLNKDVWVEFDNSSQIQGKIPTPFESDETDDQTQSGADMEKGAVVTAISSQEDQTHCPACGELLDQYYDSENDEWMCRDGTLGHDKLIYHKKCLDAEANTDGNVEPTELEEEDNEPLDKSLGGIENNTELTTTSSTSGGGGASLPDVPTVLSMDPPHTPEHEQHTPEHDEGDEGEEIRTSQPLMDLFPDDADDLYEEIEEGHHRNNNKGYKRAASTDNEINKTDKKRPRTR